MFSLGDFFFFVVFVFKIVKEVIYLLSIAKFDTRPEVINGHRLKIELAHNNSMLIT